MIYQIKPVIGKNAKKNLINYINKDNWLTEYKNTNIFEKNLHILLIQKVVLPFQMEPLQCMLF